MTKTEQTIGNYLESLVSARFKTKDDICNRLGVQNGIFRVTLEDGERRYCL